MYRLDARLGIPGYLVSEMVSSRSFMGYQEKSPTSGSVERCLSECDPNSRKRPY